MGNAASWKRRNIVIIIKRTNLPRFCGAFFMKEQNMDFFSLPLWVASFLAGVWNVLNEKFLTIRRTICLFMLGFGFCYTPALIMSHFGYDPETSTCVGYVCGVVSTKIYDALIKCLGKVPDIFAQKFGGKKDE